jgi:hypothetical protein
MRGIGAVAAWTSPVLGIAVVARVTAGGVEAPLFVLAVLLAPLLALLAREGPRPARSGFAFTIALAIVVCALGAGFRAVTDLGRVLGVEAGVSLGAAVVLVLVTTLWPGVQMVAATASALGTAALLAAVVLLGVSVSAMPWTVWSRVATRGAFELGARSEWTGEGARFPVPVTLTFTEPHQITAATPAVVRVTERDRGTTVHERQLAAGESLLLRSNDTVSIPAGARVRFEKGRRVPGAPASGVAWADGAGKTRPRLLVWWIGLTLTLAGGALMVVRPTPLSRVSAALGPASVAGVILAATCWAVYAVDAAPELSIGVSPAAVLARLAPVVADEPWRSRLLGAVVLAFAALLIGCAAALRHCLIDLGRHGSAPAVPSGRRRLLEAATWLLAVVVAAGASVLAADGWTLLWHGAGLAAATSLGPLLATRQTDAHESARARGALIGALIFVAVAVLARWPAGIGSLDAIADAPALVAVPAGWLIARLSRPRDSRRA